MRTQILAAVALLTVALAGCSDDPPSGELAGSSVAVPAEGTLNLETQAFQPGAPDPSSGTNPEYEPCPVEGVPKQDPDPVEDQRCQYGFTKINLHLMSLPDPQTSSYTAYLVDDEGAEPDRQLEALTANGTAPNLMYELSWENTSECEGEEPADPDNDPCDLTNLYESLEIRLDDVPVAVAPLQNGASFAPHPVLQGTSFTLTYAGRSVTLELSGTNSTLSYEAVFYTADGTGATTAQEYHSVSAGTNEFETEANVDTFAEVHIHVAGTKVNLAKATA